MSLQVWLPFNNNLLNQGLNRTFNLQSGTPSYGAGKITRNCLNVSSTSSALKYPALADSHSYTVCCWFNVSSYSSYNTLFCNGSDNGYGWFIRFNGSLGSLNFTVFNKTINYNGISAGNWYHLAAIVNYEKLVAILYINGVLVGEIADYTQGSTYTSGGFNIGKLRDTYYQFNGLINDFRVYDEVLSPYRIKELAKGLCLHYKLDKQYSTDITNNSTQYSISGKSTSYNETLLFTIPGSTMGVGNNGKYYKVSYQCYLDSNTSMAWLLILGDVGVWNDTAVYKEVYGQVTTKGTWVNAEFFFNSSINSSSGNTTNSNTVRVYFRNVSTNGNVATSYVRNIKIERFEESDCSGYSNVGNIYGTLSYLENTPRYNKSSSFDGSQMITVPLGSAHPTDAVTVSLWVYPTQSIDNQICISCTETGGWSIEQQKGHLNIYMYINGGYRNCTSTKGWSDLLNVWHHLSFTYDGYTIRFYIDGVQDSYYTYSSNKYAITYANNKTIIGNEATGTGSSATGSGYPFVGNISDVRIYATALSADDIKELYNTPILIDNKNVLYCKELVEDDSDMEFYKTGVLKKEIHDGKANGFEPTNIVEN